MGLVFALPGNAGLAGEVARRAGWDIGRAEIRRFPDRESYLRVDSDVKGADAAILCTLARPDGRFLQLVFLAHLLRELGARRITLIAPYLAYLRQDRRFRPGEALTSATFAALLSGEVDALITVAPHLHRYRSLGDIYRIPAAALNPAGPIAQWIGENVEAPLLIGPDGESAQWTEEVARAAGAPCAIFGKRRLGDREVEQRPPDLGEWRGRRPVIVDDIVSSGATLLAAAKHLAAQGFPPPVCIAVHALLGRAAEARLAEAGCRIVSTDTVPHRTNIIPIAPLLAAALTAG
jgi:ribose-phosphate pyrophosphokinase